MAPPNPAQNDEGALGGNVAHFTAPVADAAVQLVYQNVRYDLNGYVLTIPDGGLHGDLAVQRTGLRRSRKRVFGAAIQGRQVIGQPRRLRARWPEQGAQFQLPDVAITNGALRIDFTREVELPCIAGIVVEGTTKANNQLPGQPFTRKINCGGEKSCRLRSRPRKQRLPAAIAARFGRCLSRTSISISARANFGEAAADSSGQAACQLDGVHISRKPATGKTAPANLVPQSGALEQGESSIRLCGRTRRVARERTGRGILDRFDYW